MSGRLATIRFLGIASVIALSASAWGQTTWYVDCDSPCPGDGSLASPFCHIQDAIDAAAEGDEISVMPGTYFEHVNMSGKAITLRSQGGAHHTTIDADLDGRGITCTSGEGAETVIDGFTVTHARSGDGAGMRNEGASPTVLNCLFIDNQVVEGITRYGGGVANLADSSGIGSNGRFVNCAFVGNTALDGSRTNHGGGMANSESQPTLINCTFANNRSDTAGAIWNANGSHSVLMNCIVWENEGGEIVNDDASSAAISYSDVSGGYDGPGNIDADPLFTDVLEADVHLRAPSPCIDAGDSTAVPDEVFVDLDGYGRITDCPVITDTGVSTGITPVTVDMGPYEQRPGDLDRDFDVDLSDLAKLLAYYGS